MSVMVRLSDTEIEVLADEVLRREMTELAFERAIARSGRDHEGEPSLFITAEVGPDVPELHGDVFARLHGAIHDALLARGEERFPFFTVHRADDEAPDDDAGSTSL